MLIKLDGEPESGPMVRVQSLVLGAVLPEIDVADTASRRGDID